jgi:hypothetical protein
METARKNFRRLMQFLKDQEEIEVVSIGDLMERFAYQPEFIRKKDLQRIAETILSEKQVVYDEVYSPSEVFAGLTLSINEFAQEGKIPGKLICESPLGPMAMPPEQSGVSSVSREQLFELAETCRDVIRNQGYLPSGLTIGGEDIGTGSLLQLFSSAYLDLLKKKPRDNYEVLAFDAYPREMEESIISEVEDCKHWVVHRPDLDMSHLAEMTRMQLWTLKPAHERQ